MGEGGSIPFMAMLGEKFPQAQFVVTGVIGPHSNAHRPNEFCTCRPGGGSRGSSRRSSPTKRRVTGLYTRKYGQTAGSICDYRPAALDHVDFANP